MKLIISNKISSIIDPTKEVIDLFKNFFTLKDERKAFVKSNDPSKRFNNKKIESVKFYYFIDNKIVFFSGLLVDVLKTIKKNNIKIDIDNRLVSLEYQGKDYSDEELRKYFNPNFTYVDHQIRALKKMLKSYGGIIKATTSSGKCFGKDTDILMFNGSIKKVQDIKIGDIIMGYDSKPRNVLSVTNGIDILYKIKYKKGKGSHIVNSSHVLTLKASRDLYSNIKKNDIIDIPLMDYLNQTKDFKRVFSLFQEPVLCWEENKHLLEPYFLGVWLGDGRSNAPCITSIDEEIIYYLKDYVKNFKDLSISIYEQKDRVNNYALTGNKKKKNTITEEFKRLNLINNKHIPKEYLIDSYNNRINLLSGLLDTDGYHYGYDKFEFSNKNKQLCEDVLFLTKSLGFYASMKETKKSSQNGTIGTYYIVYISGDVHKIPTKIKRKQAKIKEKKIFELKDPTKFGFEIEKIEKGEYFGFTLDGDGRFMLGDFVVSHNTEIMLAFCKLVNLKTLILVNKQDLGKQTAKRLNDGGFSVIYRGSDKKGKVDLESSYVCTIGMAKDLPNDFDIVIVDECHRASATTFQDYLMKSKAKAFYGFSATPEGNHKVDFMKVKQHLYGIIEEINAEELLENNVIAFPNITFIDNECIVTLDWDSANELCIIHNRDRNEKIRDLVFKHKQPTLILVRNIEHGLELEKMIEGSLFVHGSKDSDFRKDVIDRMESGDLQYVIASNIFNEGISINAIRVLIVASGGKSKIETVQRLGRALRKDEGKEEAIVYDFYDYGNKYTSRHSEERMRTYKKVGFPVNLLES